MSDPHEWQRSVRARGVLAEAATAGVLQTPDIQVADRLAALADETDDRVILALALAVRAVRAGSVCLDLATAQEAAGPAAAALTWPEPDAWRTAVATSALQEHGVLQVDSGLVYLDRYWREEQLIARLVRERVASPPSEVDLDRLAAGARRVFPEPFAEQRAAATAAMSRRLSLVTGGPGTGKTTAVAGLLALLAEQAEYAGQRRPRVALTAPTGKAAARLAAAVAEAREALPPEDRARVDPPQASTLHRLLGHRGPAHTRFRHDAGNRLPHDVVVVDETSMVSLTMMARLLEALRPETRLVLVGDPDQLASVEAGAVLADLVAGLQTLDPQAVTRLRTVHRFGGAIGELASAVRAGLDDDALAVLRAGSVEVAWLDPDDPAALERVRGLALSTATSLQSAALAGDIAGALTALERHRLLCAHREGPAGAGHWNRQVERWLAEASGRPLGSAWGEQWYAGRPVIVTANDHTLGLFNGDTGVAVAQGDRLRLAFAGTGDVPLTLTPARVSDLETMHALTVHKSQGSQAREVTMVLPGADSPLLTRELLYTGITRAQSRVLVLGSPDAIRRAVLTPARRASGLRERLAGIP